jgi:hypothetical protein
MIRSFVLAVLVLSTLPSGARAGGLPVVPFGEALRSAGNITLPAAWAGVWSYEDTSYACGDPENFQTDAGVDTLCTGMPLGDEPNDPFDFDCSGSTIDDDSANITCTFSMDFGGCVVDFSISYVATRNGDTYFLTTTESQTFTPTGCGGADQCTVTETTATRIAPEPVEWCLTPVAATTWGQVKAHYR